MTIVDGPALYQYCQLFAETEALADAQQSLAAGIARLQAAGAELLGAELVACYQDLERLHATQATAAGQIRQGPLALRVYLVELGLTPAARSRVRIARPTTAESKGQGLVS